MNRRTAALTLAAALSLTSCGTQSAAGVAIAAPSGTSPTGPVTSPGTSPATGTGPRYTASLTVLEGGGHGPEMCVVVAQSLPPQCSGAALVGWDWGKVKHESQAGVRWGSYRVVGTWDGSRLTLTEPPRPAEGAPPAPPEEDFSSPCPEPEGGWRPVDPAKATDPALQAALRRAGTARDYAGGWVDQGYLDRPGVDPTKDANDPRRLVLNLRFTGDLARREAWVREVWGGALCVSRAERSQAELRAIQRKVEREVKGFVSAGVDEVKGRVELQVWVASDALRHRLDDKYGKGLVELTSVLKPV